MFCIVFKFWFTFSLKCKLSFKYSIIFNTEKEVGLKRFDFLFNERLCKSHFNNDINILKKSKVHEGILPILSFLMNQKRNAVVIEDIYLSNVSHGMLLK